jgi:hypothetical protein
MLFAAAALRDYEVGLIQMPKLNELLYLFRHSFKLAVTMVVDRQLAGKAIDKRRRGIVE